MHPDDALLRVMSPPEILHGAAHLHAGVSQDEMWRRSRNTVSIQQYESLPSTASSLPSTVRRGSLGGERGGSVRSTRGSVASSGGRSGGGASGGGTRNSSGRSKTSRKGGKDYGVMGPAGKTRPHDFLHSASAIAILNSPGFDGVQSLIARVTREIAQQDAAALQEQTERLVLTTAGGDRFGSPLQASSPSRSSPEPQFSELARGSLMSNPDVSGNFAGGAQISPQRGSSRQLSSRASLMSSSSLSLAALSCAPSSSSVRHARDAALEAAERFVREQSEQRLDLRRQMADDGVVPLLEGNAENRRAGIVGWIRESAEAGGQKEKGVWTTEPFKEAHPLTRRGTLLSAALAPEGDDTSPLAPPLEARSSAVDRALLAPAGAGRNSLEPVHLSRHRSNPRAPSVQASSLAAARVTVEGLVLSKTVHSRNMEDLLDRVREFSGRVPKRRAEVLDAGAQWLRFKVSMGNTDADLEALPVARGRWEAALTVQAALKRAPGLSGKDLVAARSALSRDEIGQHLEKERAETLALLETRLKIEEAASNLAEERSARERLHSDDMAAQAERATQEADKAQRKLVRDQAQIFALQEQEAEVLEELRGVEEKLAFAEKELRECKMSSEDLRGRLQAAEEREFHAQTQGMLHIAREQEAMVAGLRREVGHMRATLETKVDADVFVRELVGVLQGKRDLLQGSLFKQTGKAEDSRRAGKKERSKAEEAQVRREKAQEQLEVFLARAAHKKAKADATRGEAQAQAEEKTASSGLVVTERLLARSLTLIAANLPSQGGGGTQPGEATRPPSPPSPGVKAGGGKKEKAVAEAVYVGERDSVGLRSGYGIMEYPEGGEYRGEWRNDLPFGCGVERYSDGTTYEGGFLEGMRHGMGVLQIGNQGQHGHSDTPPLPKGGKGPANGALCYFGVWERGLRFGAGVVARQTPKAHSELVPPALPVGISLVSPGADDETHGEPTAFETEHPLHSLLLSDAALAAALGRRKARKAQGIALNGFLKGGHDQRQERHARFLGVTVKRMNPLLKALDKKPDFQRAVQLSSTRDPFLRGKKAKERPMTVKRALEGNPLAAPQGR